MCCLWFLSKFHCCSNRRGSTTFLWLSSNRIGSTTTELYTTWIVAFLWLHKCPLAHVSSRLSAFLDPFWEAMLYQFNAIQHSMQYIYAEYQTSLHISLLTLATWGSSFKFGNHIHGVYRNVSPYIYIKNSCSSLI
jgi:hypothetical protein